MRPSDAELLTFVFTFHVVDRVLHADGDLVPLEIGWVARLFPSDSLYARGLIDDDNVLTDRYARLLEEAREHLGKRLDDDGKAALIQTFFESAFADGEVEPREAEMIAYACEQLGVPVARIHRQRSQPT